MSAAASDRECDGGLHTAWARLFARALAASGVREAVVSPGSRSTPLALAFAREPSLRVTVCVDERSAGFFALGQARAAGAPSALLCTSGSAAAHYHPAVLEASNARVPLLVVTADRPWEAYDAAAPQTVDQVKLYGSAVRHYAELGLPDPAALEAVPRVAAQSVLATRWPDPGPVHVNARFRKPLEPVADRAAQAWAPRFEALFARGAPRVYAPAVLADDAGVASLADALRGARRPLFAAGPALSTRDARALRSELSALCASLGAPLFAEAASDLRHGAVHPRCVRVGSFEALRAYEGALASCDLLVELGLPPVGAAYAAWVASRPDLPRFVLAPHGYNDPYGTARALLLCEPLETLRALARYAAFFQADASWAALVARADANARAELDALCEPWGEAHVARRVWSLAPEGCTVLVGNGTVVRDADTFAPPSDRALRVLHQCGASGIDGLIAGAAGVRSVSDGPVLLLLGDVSVMHDAGSLALLRAAPGPLVVVAIDNGGGRIFEQLPLARSVAALSGSARTGSAHSGDRAQFERLFLTPCAPPEGLASIAAAHGVAHARVRTPEALVEALRAGFASARPLFVEVTVDGDLGVRARAFAERR